MDPLSATLAVVSLATAVKDMIELAQKIRESFAKVSNNFLSAQRVAEDIEEMLEEIKTFCDDNRDALEGMMEFRAALQGLLAKLRSFETLILPLLPHMGGRKGGPLIKGWDAWRNNSKIERSILDLQSDIMRVIRRYMLKSAMRTEAKLDSVRGELNRGLTGITDALKALEVVRRDTPTQRIFAAASTTTRKPYELSGLASNDFDHNIIMFAKSTPSTSAPMLYTPAVITEELVTAAYIKLQINSIAIAVDKLTMLPVSVSNNTVSSNLDSFHLFPILEEASMGLTHLRHYIVRHVTLIRDLLDTKHVHAISIEHGAKALNKLSVGLEALSMRQESILVGNWALVLSRMLLDASNGSRRSHIGGMLALHLFNQSGRYGRSGDTVQSLQVIEEAYTITQTLRNHYTHEAHFQLLYTDILLQYATFFDTKQSIEMTIEAVHLLEGILNVQAFTLSRSHKEIKRVVQPSSSFLDKIFSSTQSVLAIMNYALALQRLGDYLFNDGHHEYAVDLALLAVAVRRKMVSTHGHKYKVNLSKSLLSLVGGRIAACIPVEDCVNMAEECIQILRELMEKNAPSFAPDLVDVLWVKAISLEMLKRDDEAISTWEEVIMLTGEIMQDFELCAQALGNLSDQFGRLKKHDDALRTGALAISTYQKDSKFQCTRYLQLSKNFQTLQRYKESVEAARASVALCRRLVMSDSKTSMGDLTEGLSNLAHCLAASGDYSEALIAWKESVAIMESSLSTNPDGGCSVIDGYLKALRIHRSISYVLEDGEQCLKICFTAGQYLCRLTGNSSLPENVTLYLSYLWSSFHYTYNLLRLDYLQDAEEYIDDWLNVWSSKPEAILRSDVAAIYAAMLLLKADILEAQGYPKQALSTAMKVHDIVRPSMHIYQPSFSQVIDSMIFEARHQVNIGNSQQAMRVAEEALQLSRDNKLEPVVENMVWSLYAVATIALSCQDYTRTAEVAQEGCNISSRPIWRGMETEHNIFIRPSLFSILSSTEANLGRYSTALQYAQQAVDASLAIKDMKATVSATTAEKSYIETRGSLAEILLATGDLAQARQICEERRAYFSKRVERRMSDYRELAPILRMLGILCCSEGHHEEGHAAARELSRIMGTLGSAFPSLQQQVKIRLRNQRRVPILKTLNDMSEKLDCEHQSGIVSLFEI